MTKRSVAIDQPIAVIMSVYHGDDPKHFRDSLDSIFSQTISSDVEIRLYLAVDGPVKSELNEVISDYSDNIYKLVRRGKNNGLAQSLNDLIACLGNEPFIFRMDADDLSLPDRFEQQLLFMENNPVVDILGGAILEFRENNLSPTEVKYPLTNLEARSQIAYRSPVAHPTVCFRKSVFSAVGSYPELNGNEDIALWFKCMKVGLIFANLPDPILRFRVSETFWDRRGINKSWSELCCYLKGMQSIEGTSPRMVLPILRFLFRLTPMPVRKLSYRARGRLFQ